MTPSPHSAYLAVLFHVLLDIRSASGTHRLRWWSPGARRRAAQRLAHIHRLADAFHFLPEVLALKPETFDESAFWQLVEETIPEHAERYRALWRQHACGQPPDAHPQDRNRDFSPSPPAR